MQIDEILDEDGYYVYLLQCENGAFYCGWTVNLKKRWQKHCSKKGAKYTRANPPVCLYYFESLASASEARKREYEIKQMSHKEKEALKMGNGEK